MSQELNEAVRKRWERQEAERIALAATRDTNARIEDYKPTEFAPGLFMFLVAALPCVHCSRPTTPGLDARGARGPFPFAWSRSFDAQRERAGIQPLAHWRDINEPVCVGCKDAGEREFECSHCKQKRPLNESHSSYGSPAEHLCTHCYATVPAKQWEGLVAELEEQHRYDFE